MIVLSTMTAQTLQPGQSITFEVTNLHCGNRESHRQGSSAIKLRMAGIYDVRFQGSITAPVAGDIQLAVQLGGETLNETLMTQTVSLANTQFKNVSASTYVKNQCGDYDRITVTNVGTTDVTINPGSSINVRRVCG